MEACFKAGEKVYYLSPMTFGDLHKFSSWVQYREWYQFQLLKETFPSELFEPQSQAIFAKCSEHKPTEAEVSSAMASVDGSIYLILLSVKRNHPTVNYEELSGALSMPVLADAAQKLSMLSGVKDTTPLTASEIEKKSEPLSS